MLVLKLVGNTNIEYRINIDTEFTLDNILSLLKEKEIDVKYLDKIKYIYKGVYITNTSLFYPIENQCLYLFTLDTIIRDELIKLVFQETYSDSPPCYNEVIKCNQLLDINEIPCDIDVINKQVITLFEDPDFSNLLRISLVKPHLIGLVNSYLMNGNISEKIQIKDCPDFQYEEQYKVLEGLGFITNEIMTKSILTHFNGHLNMSIRYIIWLNHTKTE